MINIEKHANGIASEATFSIVIPSWNNLEYLKLCVKSITKHSYFKHQIIIHVNEGTDGTLDWVKAQQVDYTYSAENVGICYSLNFARTLMTTDYVVYINDDMYVCPDWDKILWDAIQASDTDLFFYSATMIEPHSTTNRCVIAPVSFGTSPDTFEEDRLLSEYKTLEKSDWFGATWPPNVVHRDTWDLVGGYSIEFSPGMSSDPDFSKKLWEAGVRDFRGFGQSRVYHFGSKTTGRIIKNPGNKQFLHKWGLTSATFMNLVLRRGQPVNGSLSIPNDFNYNLQVFRGKLKKWLTRV